MDHQENREKYREQYPEYFERLVLNEKLKTSIMLNSPAVWNAIEVCARFISNFVFTKQSF